MLGRTETRTHDRMYCQTIRTVRYISRDDRAIIATCSLRTPTDRLKDNYSIDFSLYCDYMTGKLLKQISTERAWLQLTLANLAFGAKLVNQPRSPLHDSVIQFFDGGRCEMGERKNVLPLATLAWTYVRLMWH